MPNSQEGIYKVLTRFNSIEQVFPLRGFLDRVHLRVDILNHDLESIEASRLGNLNVVAKAFNEVLVDNTIRRGKEGEDVRNKVTLVFRQLVVPIFLVVGEVDFFGGPEGRFSLFIKLPNLEISVGTE
ncbi:hypothetical protein BC938DRAFT_478709 [Jimgerdemannia flammicorona]|uniref:Uncharacterized protein n=1 Tax=Jimgerdemannia flammicorona TaxID=994334 RepID=A0A433QME7_9FUNG|nr:hypothetical protein BC938DRAFT_478709 [Jimgerdemannia flammicorona]